MNILEAVAAEVGNATDQAIIVTVCDRKLSRSQKSTQLAIVIPAQPNLQQDNSGD